VQRHGLQPSRRARLATGSPAARSPVPLTARADRAARAQLSTAHRCRLPVNHTRVRRSSRLRIASYTTRGQNSGIRVSRGDYCCSSKHGEHSNDSQAAPEELDGLKPRRVLLLA
jgi:hypothetical protein